MDTKIPGTTRNIGLLQLVHATSNELTSLIDQEKEEKKEGIKNRCNDGIIIKKRKNRLISILISNACLIN